MSNKIDTEILEALKLGDHKAFETVFIVYYNKIKIFVDSYIKSEADAEELAEELFVNLWTNHRAIDTTRSFNSYLHTMARNASLNFLKHKYVRDAYAGRAETLNSSHSTEDDLIAKETALLVEMTVDKMPAQRKEIYRCSRNEGLSNEEIAIRLDTTKRNVESQLSLALKDIRRVVMTYILFLP